VASGSAQAPPPSLAAAQALAQLGGWRALREGAGGAAHVRSKKRGAGDGVCDERERGARSKRRRWGAQRTGARSKRRRWGAQRVGARSKRVSGAGWGVRCEKAVTASRLRRARSG
jgi:hypothetical protein